MPRPLIAATTILVTLTCACAESDGEVPIVQIDGKADGIDLPIGTYEAITPREGELARVVLETDMTFVRDQITDCAATPCSTVRVRGTYAFSGEGVFTYITFRDDHGVIDKYGFHLAGRGLDLLKIGASNTIEMVKPDASWCAQPADCAGQGVTRKSGCDWACGADETCSFDGRTGIGLCIVGVPGVHCLTGSLVLTAATGVFAPLDLMHIDYGLSFEIVGDAKYIDPSYLPAGQTIHEITTGPVVVRFDGDPTGLLDGPVATSLSDTTLKVRLLGNDRGAPPLVLGYALSGAPRPTSFTLAVETFSAMLPLDANGYPQLDAFAGIPVTTTATTTTSGVARGTGTLTYVRPPVAPAR